MICQFSFANFKSYKNETTLDFQAEPIPEFADSVIKQDKCSELLPVSAIYGPNGGGKSNVLQALACLISTVVKPIHDLEKNRVSLIIQQHVAAEPFLYDEVSKKKPTEFRVFFRQGTYEYCYYLEILDNQVVSEILDRKMCGNTEIESVFSREGETITLGSILAKEQVNTNVNLKMPFISFLAINYNIPVIADVQTWFESCIIQSYANPMVEQVIMVPMKVGLKKKILQLLNDMDIDVQNYRFDTKTQEVYLTRAVSGHTYELSFNHESDGTKKLIAMLPSILIALQEGRLVIIDELDAKLHPKLLRYVIALFTDSKINKHGAQLLFTSHDMFTLKNTVFRRDEIWFAALDKDHSSELYSLYEMRNENNERVTNTAAYDKQYIEGRYGADPYLKSMLSEENW